MKKTDLQKYNLPDAPGVYVFMCGKEVTYVGKATSLRDRVKSYFSKDLLATRGGKVAAAILDATTLQWHETESVLEALILEANLIKKHTPSGNTREKDNKSFNYVVVTEEDFPRVLMVRGRELFAEKSSVGALSNVRHMFGPYPDSSALKEAVRIVRKIFPFRDTCIPAGTLSASRSSRKNGVGARERSEVGKDILERSFSGRVKQRHVRSCFNKQLGLCPGVCDGTCTKKEYSVLVRNIILFFSGKKKELLRTLERDMKRAATKEAFEVARTVQRQLHALTHIRDVSLLKKEQWGDDAESDGGVIELHRIEAYDVAHISGTNTVGVMVVMEGGEIQKNEIRKFIIRTSRNDDLASLAELLTRRFRHAEWRIPNLIVIDGGESHIVHARRVLKSLGVASALVSVVKDERHKARGIIGDEAAIARHKDGIIRLNVEAHAQAVRFHRARRSRAYSVGNMGTR